MLDYPRFARSHSLFYDRARPRRDAVRRFAPTAARPWREWESHLDEAWSLWRLRDQVLAEQGWKVHVSATPATAQRVLEACSLYCHDRGIPFKFLRDRACLDSSISKDADRASSGKFITIYPPDEDELDDALHCLDNAIGGLPGPHVLSDLRWKLGPLYVRYGAYKRMYTLSGGQRVLAVRNPTSGELVEDVREPRFVLPQWVDPPSFLKARIEARDLTPPTGFPLITRALHHSNAGGVYEAEFDGVAAVLKEARPYVGWTPDGRDAITRLRDEEQVLRALDGASTPSVLGAVEVHGHRFLALERVDGKPLNDLVVARHPLVRHAPTADSRRSYRDWALKVMSSLRCAVGQLHDAGRTHGDLHPGNVMVQADDSVVLVDLEMSRDAAATEIGAIGVPGFVPTDGRHTVERDSYALACIELFVFIPLTPLIPLHPAKAAELVAAASGEFELEAAWARRLLAALGVSGGEATVVRARLDGPASGPPRNVPVGTLIAGITRGLEADSTAERRDRLWPGDPVQFLEPPYGIAHGALGVMAALALAGHVIESRELHWVEEAVVEHSSSYERAGLLDGLAGAVWAFRQIGAHRQAERALRKLEEVDVTPLGTDLYSGLAGIGLVFLAESEAEPNLFDRAICIAEQLRDRWVSTTGPSRVATGAGGLLCGATGTALFALRLYERTGDPAHLRLACDAIDYDLASLLPADDGSLQVNEGWRATPYLGCGSAGIGIVLVQIAPHVPRQSRYPEVILGIARAAGAPFTVQSGLFDGRAGLMQFLLALDAAGSATSAAATALADHVAALDLHALPHVDGVRFAGNALLRASCDLATGAAGILTTLVAYRDGAERYGPASAGIPYLASSPPQRRDKWDADRPRGGERR